MEYSYHTTYRTTSNGKTTFSSTTDYYKKVYSGGPPAPSGYHLGAADSVISEAAKPEDAVPYGGRSRSYDEIKQRCLDEGNLFYDPHFPADDESLYYSQRPPYRFEWKRPHEIVDDPKFIVDDATRFDVTQGRLGDCWLLASIASLCNDQSLFAQVVPEGQTFDDGDYCGLFRFRFWQYGQWEEVIIDDRLPTYNGKIVFLHSAENTEFWSPLLEKAYAKLHGSYEALSGGLTAEAMVDFTGGVPESYELKGQQPENLFDLLLKVQRMQCLMCAAINAKRGEIEARMENGLVMGHAYTITKAVQVSMYNLLLVRNPWGDGREWNGAWSDESVEWYRLTDEEKEEIGLEFKEDGEYWMSFDDFCENFDRLDICLLSPVAAGDVSTNSWEMKLHQGTWQKYVSAGGCRNYPDTFYMNPQYRIKLDCPDEDYVDENKCTLVVALMQKSRRKQRALGEQNLSIGFSIYQLDENIREDHYEHGRLNKEYFLYNASTARSNSFINSREVSNRFLLPCGEYVIIPSTYEPHKEGDFLLRLFSEQEADTKVIDTATQVEIKEKPPKKEDDDDFDTRFKRYFDDIAGEDDEIDPFELQNVVNKIFKEERDFTIDACRSMLSMVDRDRNGRLSYYEFRVLWRRVMEWEQNFETYDKNDDGEMLVTDLRTALSDLGFTLNTPSLSSIALRWATRNGGIGFEDYIQICCRVKAAFDSFLSFQGKSFSLNNYIMQAIYI